MAKQYKPVVDKDKLREGKIIDSHASALTNQRMYYVFLEIDKAGILARTSFHYDDIVAYFGTLEQAWTDVADVVTNPNECDLIRKEFVRLQKEILCLPPEGQTVNKLFDLLDQATALNREIVRGLQEYLHYFFRVSRTQKKGLAFALGEGEETNDVAVE